MAIEHITCCQITGGETHCILAAIVTIYPLSTFTHLVALNQKTKISSTLLILFISSKFSRSNQWRINPIQSDFLWKDKQLDFGDFLKPIGVKLDVWAVLRVLHLAVILSQAEKLKQNHEWMALDMLERPAFNIFSDKDIKWYVQINII